MGDLFMWAVMFGAGLFVGWVFLPEPLWFREMWAKTGLADKD